MIRINACGRCSTRHGSFAPSWFLALPALLLAVPALAAPLNHGDFPGVTVDYLQVTEDANSVGDTPPLFGVPQVVGDTIDFDPVGFDASSANGAASDSTIGQLLFTVRAKPGKAIKSLTVAEAGDVNLNGLGTDATFASVATNIFVDVNAVDGAPHFIAGNIPFTIPFTPSGGTFGQGTDGGGGPIFNASWFGSVLIDVNAILTANNVQFVTGATEITVNLNNILNALSETGQPGTSATIAKKNANGVTITVNIPEPSTYLMAGMALVGAVAWRKKSA